MSKQPTTVYFFPNGNTACCDQAGQQMGELQQSWFLMWIEFVKSKGFDPAAIKEIHLPSGRAKLLTFTDDDGTVKYNWQMA